jgi:2-polyprenyl-3-methyl-5-hydroxy-6-metoxy-1,4-benzoquinol methylase
MFPLTEEAMHKVLRETKARFQPAVQKIMKTTRGEAENHAVYEAAFPAYAQTNPLIDLVFWRRLSVAFDEACRHGGRRALDFGCGPGLMSEALATAGFGVTAVDLDLSPNRLLEEQIRFSKSITFVEGDLPALDLAPESFDVILALDVLEHISERAPYVKAFERLLSPGGVVIVSGPTENWLYQLGRKVAGEGEFSGHFHVCNIDDVAASLRERFEVRTIARIIWPATLFEILACRKNVSGARHSSET